MKAELETRVLKITGLPKQIDGKDVPSEVHVMLHVVGVEPEKSEAANLALDRYIIPKLVRTVGSKPKRPA